MLFQEPIVPYEGTTSIRLYQGLEDVKCILFSAGVPFVTERWQNDYETVSNPWTVLILGGWMSLFFAGNNKLFKIVFGRDYVGKLPNGIHTGMNLGKALEVDESLTYDDWNEDYESEQGFWLEDDIEKQEVLSISIFIRELLDEEYFDQCGW